MSAKVHLRSVAPTPPTITTRGKASRDKSKLACDWETYLKAIVDNREDPYADDVQKIREHLQSATFTRWRQDITDAVTEQHMRTQVTEAAKRMRELADRKHPPLMNLRVAESRTFKGCSACDYDKWCTAGRRPLLMCFNRPLAERLKRIVAPGGQVTTWYGFCDRFLQSRGVKGSRWGGAGEGKGEFFRFPRGDLLG